MRGGLDCRAVAPKLHPGEQVLFEGHPSWRSILDFYLKGVAATAVIALVVGFATKLFGDETDTGLVTVVALIGVALTILIGFVKRVATNYTITNRRLHIKRGIVSRTIQETRLERVQNVNYQPVGAPADAADRRRRLRHRRPATTTTSSSPASPSPATSSTWSTRPPLAAAPRRPRRRVRSSEPALAAALERRARGSGAPSASRLAQRVRLVGALPGEVGVLAAEVAVGRGLLVDRPVQVELLAERARAQVEVLGRSARRSAPGAICSVPKVSTITETGWATPIA